MVRHFYTVIFLCSAFCGLVPLAAADGQMSVPAGNKVWSSLENREVVSRAELEDAPVKAVQPQPASQVSDTSMAAPKPAESGINQAAVPSAQVAAEADKKTEPPTSLPAKSAAPEPLPPAAVVTPQDVPTKAPQNLQAEIPYVDSAAEVLSIGAHIYDVKGIGSWQNAHMMGQIRMVITRNSKRDDIYLQWVAWRDDTPKAIVASEAVEGINRDANYRVKAISSQIMQGKPQITLSLEDKYSKELLRGVIRIIDVGRFECQVLR